MDESLCSYNTMKKIPILFFIYILSTSSFAYDTALTAFDECTSDGETEIERFKELHCLGYVNGYLDGIRLSASKHRNYVYHQKV